MKRLCQSWHRESQNRGNYFSLCWRSHDQATGVCIQSFLPEDISVSQSSEWIQLKTPLFESPARISMYKSMPDVTAPHQEHTRCQGESSHCWKLFFSLMRNIYQYYTPTIKRGVFNHPDNISYIVVFFICLRDFSLGKKKPRMHRISHACCTWSFKSDCVSKGSSGDTAGWRMWCSVSHVPAGVAVFLSPPLWRNQLCSTCFTFHLRFEGSSRGGTAASKNTNLKRAKLYWLLTPCRCAVTAKCTINIYLLYLHTVPSWSM